jgi:glycosyltransferase involved in cell wall biosynthesis
VSRPARLLLVNPSGVRGGAEALLLALAAHADPGRLMITFACLADGPFTDELAATGARIQRLRAGRLRNPLEWARAVRGLTALARAHDAVLSWQVKGHYYGTPAARRARRPVAWWDHGIRPARGEPRFVIDALLPRAVRADLVVCSSASAAMRHRPARVIHPGADLEVFAAPDRSRARAALGIGDDDVAIGIVGRLQPWKGQHVLLEAAPAILAVEPRARFLVIGGTPGGFSAGYPAALERQVAALAIAERVSFLGQRDDVAALLPGLDVFVHASRDEPFGIVIVEAMAAGVPVVATDAGGVPEIVVDGEHGLLVPPEDAPALAEAVAATLADPGAARTRVDAARARAFDRFGWARYVREVSELVEEMIR